MERFEHKNVRGYIDEFGTLWLEKGEYTSYSGDTTFHGSRLALNAETLHEWLDEQLRSS